ncbi:MAG: phosphatidate cytidylyltransferase [Actinomycetota bacterium]|jgi:phosphatidate cytidylyltransferase
MDEWDSDHEEELEPTRPRAEGVRILGAEEAAAAVNAQQPEGEAPNEPLPFESRVRAPVADDQSLFSFDDPEPSMPPVPAAAPPNLPHWTEPATGEVPAVLSGRFGESDLDVSDDDEPEDDLAAWSALSGGAPRWRDQHDVWDDAGFDDASVLAGSEPPLGALDESRTSIFSFDEPEAIDDEFTFGGADAEEIAPIPLHPTGSTASVTARPPRPRAPRPARPVGAGPRRSATTAPRDMQSAVVLGAGLAVAALFLFWLGPAWAMLLATAVVVMASAELYDVLRRAGYQPATLVGLIGTLALMIAAYQKGETALPLAIVLVFGGTFAWYLIRVVHARPTVNVAATLMAFLWTGVLGSYAALLLGVDKHGHTGVAFILAAVVATVANDIGAFFVGSRMGSKPLAPEISPNKTIEGLVGGAVCSILATEILLRFVHHLHPLDGGKLLWLAIVVSVVAPLGDLAESMIKRDLGIKDMGNLLPGHGGVLDRFDAMLFVLPATYYLLRVLY